MVLKISRGKLPTAISAVIYGTEGIGKTTLASRFPAPLFLDTEGGTDRMDVDRARIRTWLELEGAFHELVREHGNYETVVVDSADWAEAMAKDHVCRSNNKPSIESFGYGKGQVMVGEAVKRLLGLADQLVERGVNVVFVAHAKVVRVSPPDQTDGFDRYELKMDKNTSPIFKEWADLVLFCNYKTHIVEGQDGRMKAKGGGGRVMYAVRSPAYDAKNRFGLPGELPMTIEALAPVFAGTAPRVEDDPEPEAAAEPGAEEPLAESIARHIREATSVRALGRMGDRIDQLVSEGQLTADEWSRLTDAIQDRHDQIEPARQGGDQEAREEVTT